MQLSWKEELANAITHGIGFILSIVALVFLILRAASHPDNFFLGSAIIFGISMITLYLCSTLLHSIPFQKTKKLFTILDHSAIYILIAGTYTPLLLVTVQGTLGWTLFVIIWSIAVLGVTFKAIFVDRFNVISTVGYLVMGWLVVIAIVPIYQSLHLAGFILLVGGGVLYSLGTIFYLWERLPYSHAIWHLFVLAGSACMFFCIFFFVY